MLELLSNLRFLDIIDILIVSILIYYILLWFHASRAFQLFKGFLFIAFIFILSKLIGLYTIQWLLQKLAAIMVVLLIIVFQPELRKALEQLGRHSIFSTLLGNQPGRDIVVMNEIIRAVDELSEKKIGALIVLEKSTGLGEYVETGLEMDALVREDLLVSIFQKNSPLHDGAVIIQDSRILAVSCLLPLSESKQIDTKLGTRHRAAVGITELSDALVIIVSEETGVISMAENGELKRYLNRQNLEEKLLSLQKQPTADLLQKVGGFFSEQFKKKV